MGRTVAGAAVRFLLLMCLQLSAFVSCRQAAEQIKKIKSLTYETNCDILY